MILVSKIFGLVSTILSMVTLVCGTLSLLLLISLNSIIHKTDSVKNLLKTDSVREAFLQQEFVNSEDLTIEEEGELTDEEVDQSIELAIDNIYLWLEGRSESPAIVITQQEISDDPLGIEKIAEQKIGPLAQFIDYKKVNEAIDSEVPLLNLQSNSAQYLPNIYQNGESWIKNIVIFNIIVASLLVFSAGNIRRAVLYIGICGTLSSLIIIYGPKYIKNSDVNSFYKSVPLLENAIDTKQLSTFSKRASELILKESLSNSKGEAKILLTISIITIIISQLTIRERLVEVEED